ILFVGATLCGCPLLAGHAGPALRARQSSLLTGPLAEDGRTCASAMTLRLFFARLASNATPRGFFSAALYSVLYRLRDHPPFAIIPPTPAPSAPSRRDRAPLAPRQPLPLRHPHAPRSRRPRPR